MGAQLIRLCAAVGIALAAAGSARAEQPPGYGGSVVASLLGEPVSLDPVRAHSHAEVSLTSLVFDSLYRIDSRGRAQPHLASALPRTAGDRLTVRIPLVAGATFHDGSQVGADDVVASLRRLQSSSEADWLLAPVREIRAEDGEVVLRLRRDTPELALLLSAPQAAVTKGGAAPRIGAVIGSGPFRVGSFDRRRQRVLLTAFETHFAGRPYLDAVELRWFRDPDEEARRYERGLSHLSLRGAAAFSGHQPKYATDEVEGPATLLVYVGFGSAHRPITHSRDFRRALSLSIARVGLKGVGAGERVVPSVYPDAVDIGGEATERSQRVERATAARTAMARAVSRVSALAPARRPELEVLIDDSRPDDREVAEKIVAALYRLGVRARITALPAVRFDSRVRRGACDLYVGQLATPLPSPALATAAAFAAGDDNWTERMLAKTRLRDDGTRAWFEQRLPILPLFHRAVRVHHRRNLRGIGFDRLSRIGFADIFEHGPAPLAAKRRRRR
jgi:MarR-like DNA-binding transcriptional regulator SgrR of sgrS sRNA